MSTPLKLGVYALGLVAVFAAALGAGRWVGPSAAAATHHIAAGGDVGTAQSAGTDAPPGGLQVTQDGYRIVPVTRQLPVGAVAAFSFQVIGPDGAAVRAYTRTHDKDLHLIVVRRDLSGFQHVHPSLGADGIWSVPLAVPAPGQYRVFADFRPAAREQGLVLGVDVPAAGDYVPVALPAPARTTSIDGYTVTLAGDLVAGTAAELTLTVSRDGRPVTNLQPYLAAYGHLVALRDGDLAYLHVHPDGAPGDGRTAAGPQLTFYAEVPSTGAYRLYLDFQHAGEVHTAEFTAVAANAPGSLATDAGPAATAAPTHEHEEH